MAQGIEHVPTDETLAVVEALASCGVPQARIASHIGISERCLRDRYGDLMSHARERADSAVYMTLYTLATSGECPAATIFWAKTRLGWSEKMVLEQRKEEEPVWNWDALSNEEVQTLHDLVSKMSA